MKSIPKSQMIPQWQDTWNNFFFQVPRNLRKIGEPTWLRLAQGLPHSPPSLHGDRLTIGYLRLGGESCRVETESDGTRRSTGGEVKGKEANGVGSQHPCTVWEHGLSSITTADAHTSAASSRLNWHPRRYIWTRPFRWKTKSGLCVCAITFQTCSNSDVEWATIERCACWEWKIVWGC